MNTYFSLGRFYVGLHWTTQTVRAGGTESDIAWIDHELVFAFLGICCQFNWRESHI